MCAQDFRKKIPSGKRCARTGAARVLSRPGPQIGSRARGPGKFVPQEVRDVALGEGLAWKEREFAEELADDAVDRFALMVTEHVDTRFNRRKVVAETADEDRVSERLRTQGFAGAVVVSVDSRGQLGDPPKARIIVTVGAGARAPETRTERVLVGAPAEANEAGGGDDGEVSPNAGVGSLAALQRETLVDEDGDLTVDLGLVAWETMRKCGDEIIDSNGALERDEDVLAISIRPWLAFIVQELPREQPAALGQ